MSCDSKELFVQQFCIKIKHVEGQNQRIDTLADFTVLWYGCQKQPPEALYKKVVLENFAVFTGKQLGFLFNKVASLQAHNFLKKEIPTVVSCGYCEIFKTTYFEKHL